MSSTVGVFLKGSTGTAIMEARWCVSFFCRLRGLMFRRGLPEGRGLVLVEGREGITNTTIHMIAVPFPIGVLWVNEQQMVVDKVVAKPWRIYAPAKPARYIIEGLPSVVDEVSVGDKLEFNEIAAT
jgi:uncharacterized membrane protein (UPF0127 family)